MRRRHHHPPAARCPANNTPNRSKEAVSSPSVGSSNNHNAAGLNASRASASRRRCPADSIRAGKSASPSNPNAASAPLTSRDPAANRKFSAAVNPDFTASKCPRYATRRACPGKSANASAPSHSNAPASGRFNPANSRNSVDFPDPFGPNNNNASPPDTANDTSRNTSRSPRNAASARPSNLVCVCGMEPPATGGPRRLAMV